MMAFRFDVRRFARFLAVGLLAGSANIGSRAAFGTFFGYGASVAMAYGVGMAVGFTLMRWLVFPKGSGTALSQFRRFAMVNTLSFAEVWLVSVGLAEHLFPSLEFTWHAETAAHVLGVGSPAISSYLLHRYFSFAERSHTGTPAEHKDS